MRALKYLASCVAFALVLCAGSFAKDTNSGSFDLQQAAQLGSTVLQPGHYTAEWSGPKDAVKINILQHGKTVATAEGKLKDLPAKSPYGAVSLRTQTNNNPRVDEIDFDNRSEALVVGGM
jgi:hypothetical protein